MKRILVLVEHYYPSLDGVANVTKYRVDALIKSGYDVDVATVDAKAVSVDSESQDIISGVRVFRFDISEDKLFGTHGGGVERFYTFIRNSKYDAVVIACAGSIVFNLALRQWESLPRKKILYMHGMASNILPFFMTSGSLANFAAAPWNWVRYKIYARVIARYVKLFDSVIDITENSSASKYLQRLDVRPMTVPNAIPGDIIKNVRGNKKNNMVLNVGNYVAEKNQGMLLKAFYLCESTKEAELVFVGSIKTKILKRLKKQKIALDKKFGIRNVNFLVGVSRKKVVELYEEAGIYVSTSWHEEFSISLLEAMASNCSVISTDCGNADSLRGVKVVAGMKGLAEQIDAMLNDDKKQIGQAKLAHDFAVGNFTLKKTNKLFLSVVNDVFAVKGGI